jgi:hypothetical protein
VRCVRQPGDSCNVSPDTAPVQRDEVQRWLHRNIEIYLKVKL